MDELRGLRVAILITDGFEQIACAVPRQALTAAGAETAVVSPKDGSIRGWNLTEWGDDLPVDVALAKASVDDFDALFLPGGLFNPDALRMQPAAIAFISAFFAAGKPVAAIGHGLWTIIETGVARGRRLTSWPSLQTDLRNAGADWVDAGVVVDRGFVTGRGPDDLPAFSREMIALFATARDRTQPPGA